MAQNEQLNTLLKLATQISEPLLSLKLGFYLYKRFLLVPMRLWIPVQGWKHDG